MENRFIKCKSFEDLYDVFCTEDVESFYNLTKEELERVHVVFEANLPCGAVLPIYPLNEKGYTYIWNVVIEEVETAPIPDEEVVSEESLENMEEDMMKELLEKTAEETAATPETKATATIAEAIKSMEQATKQARVELGKDKEVFTENCDKAIDSIKNAMGPVLQGLDDIVGCSALKEKICRIIYKNKDINSKNGFFQMAEECRKAVEEQVKLFERIDPNDKLGKIAALKTYIQAVDTDGNTVYVKDDAGKKIIDTKQSIWSAFAKALVWVCKKVTRKLKRWFGVNEESNVFGAVGASIAQAFATVGNVIKNAAKIAGNAFLYIASYAVAGVIKLADMVVTAIKFVATKIKGWYKAAKEKFTKEDVEEEILEEDEEFFAE